MYRSVPGIYCSHFSYRETPWGCIPWWLWGSALDYGRVDIWSCIRDGTTTIIIIIPRITCSYHYHCTIRTDYKVQPVHGQRWRGLRWHGVQLQRGRRSLRTRRRRRRRRNRIQHMARRPRSLRRRVAATETVSRRQNVIRNVRVSRLHTHRVVVVSRSAPLTQPVSGKSV